MIIIHAQGEQRAEGRPDDVFWICSLATGEVHTRARRNIGIGRGVVSLEIMSNSCHKPFLYFFTYHIFWLNEEVVMSASDLYPSKNPETFSEDEKDVQVHTDSNEISLYH